MAKGPGLAARLGAMSIAGALMTGCAAGGPLSSPSAPASPEFALAASDGSAVAASEWLPEGQPAAVILALHGFGDYGHSTFHLAAEAWKTRGIATIAPDQRGFGRNPSRGRWPGAGALIADAQTYATQVRHRFPCAPLVVLGHSMGGGIALAAAGDGMAADGLVLAAPAIWGGDRMNPFHRLAAWLAASVVPERRFTGQGVVRIQASDNIEILRALGRDPHYLSPPSAREIFGLVRLTDRAHLAAGQVGAPALLLLGAKDQIVPNRTVREVFSTMDGADQVIEYTEGWHLLFRDLQAARVWRDVADWALAGAPADCAAGQAK